MRILNSEAPFLGVNCYAFAADNGSDCVLVDAGYGNTDALAAGLQQHGLTPVAVLLTHGHVDHVLGLPDYMRHWDVPVWLHEADVYRLDDPAATMSAQFQPMLADVLQGWAPPTPESFADGHEWDLAGLQISAHHLPGHTEGSTVFSVTDGSDRVYFSGDVLFAGSIGRTDLPGGDHATMQESLAALRTFTPAPVYPGHGPGTELSHEVATNPFLVG